MASAEFTREILARGDAWLADHPTVDVTNVGVSLFREAVTIYLSESSWDAAAGWEYESTERVPGRPGYDWFKIEDVGVVVKICVPRPAEAA